MWNKDVLKMRILSLFLIFFVVRSTLGVGFIKNAKGENCSDGICKEVCVFENIVLSPGTEEINDGKCRKIQCNHDFSVTIK